MLVVLAVFSLSTLRSAYAQNEPHAGHRFLQEASNPPSLQSLENSAEPSAPADIAAPIVMQADYVSRFTSESETALLLRQNCLVRQGDQEWRAPTMVLWETASADGKTTQVVAYLEGSSEEQVLVKRGGHQESLPYAVQELQTSAGIEYTGDVVDLPQNEQAPVVARAQQRRKESRARLQQTQYTYPTPLPAPGTALPAPAPAPAFHLRRHVTVGPRFLGERLEYKSGISSNSQPPEYVITFPNGVNIVVDNVPVEIDGRVILTHIDLTADMAVVWTEADGIGEFGNFDIDENTKFQVYLEGNIIVRQGGNDIRASHAFYDVNSKRGLALNAEVRTYFPDYEGTLRLRAEQVRLLSETKFHAKNAYFTTSEFGKPKYRIEAADVFLEERFNPYSSQVDPVTGQPDQGTLWVTSLNNRIYIGDVPIFATPYLSSPAEDPGIPVRKLTAGYSGIFGAQIETEWALDTLLGLDLPPNSDWRLELDYMSQRGPAIGTKGEYDFEAALFGRPVHSFGFGNIYYINDNGEDNLGFGRRNLDVPNHNRGSAIWRNRTEIDPYTYVQSEIGYVLNNDRNFREQYFENDWDRGKDLENLTMLNHQYDNLTGSVLVSGRTNDFSNQTNWLPKADLTFLGEPLFDSPVVWSSHSSLGYGDIQPADAPPDPVADPFAPLPFYTDVAGLVAQTRHELSLPFNVGPVNVVPYALGEVAYWSEDLNGDQLGRFYGGGGVRANVQFSKYMPEVRSRILGLNGLAHKVNFEADYFYGQSSADISRVPQYNAFDEDAQERFRERFLQIEFGGTLPSYLNSRNYAIRSGAGRSVTAPYHELVDDINVLWLGMRHRWQTKVGPPQAQRVVDWMELDLGTAIFPQANRDDFGETFGLLTGRYAWHVSPRTSFVANGVADFFNGGQEVWDVGILNQRPARGSMYVGFRQVEVDSIKSQLVTGSFSYVMSPNLYVATFGAAFDVSEGIDRGESLTITRIGEYFLFHVGLGYDRSRDNVGVAFSLEPKFGSYGNGSVQLNSLLGIP